MQKITLKQFYNKFEFEIDAAIRSALDEDYYFSDITTNTVFVKGNYNKKIDAILLCKEDCIAAGIEIFKRVVKTADPGARFVTYKKDGDFVRNKQKVLKVKSTLKRTLAWERTALNFVQRMSGISTLTNYFVKHLKFRGSKILHTRKTTPNFRLFEIAAVKIGGGEFHRFNLGSSIMVKDNHIISASSLEKILNLMKRKKITGIEVEVEVKKDSELKSVLRFGKGIVNTVMLDNYKFSELKKAVSLLKGNGFKVEISGGISLANFADKQVEGVDYYSIGMITHSYKSVDFSLEF